MASPPSSEKPLKGRSVLIAWPPLPKEGGVLRKLDDPDAGIFLGKLEALLGNLGASVTISHVTSEVEASIDSGNLPDLFIAHMNFPKIGAANLIKLLREPYRTLPQPIATIAVSSWLIGADRSQFRWDLGVDELLTEDDSLEDVEQAIFRALTHPAPSLPAVYLCIDDSEKEQEIEARVGELGQSVEIFHNLMEFEAAEKPGGIVVAKKEIFDGNARVEKVARSHGVIVVLDDLDSAREMMMLGAIDCVSATESPDSIAFRCRRARRQRARSLLEARLSREIDQLANKIYMNRLSKEEQEGKTLYEARFETLLRRYATAFIIHDVEGNILEFNSKAVDLFGYKEDELKRMKVGELHPPELAEERVKNFEEFLKNGQLRFEIDFLRANGTTFLGEAIAEFEDSEGRIAVAVSDISADRFIEGLPSRFNRLEADNVSGEINSALVELSAFSSFLKFGLFLEMESGDDLVCEFAWNNDLENVCLEKGEKLSRESLSRVMGSEVQYRIGEEITSEDTDLDPDCVKEINRILDVRESGPLLAIPLVVDRVPLGIFFAFSADPDGIAGARTRVAKSKRVAKELMQVIGYSLLRKRRVEDFVKEAEARHERDKAETIANLSSGIAHDYRNLLTGVLGNASYLMSLDSLREKSDVQSSLKVIEDAASRAVELSEDLFAFVRREKHQECNFHAHDTIEKVCGLFQHSINPLINLKVVLDAEADLLHGDLGQMHRALMNLLINASEALDRVKHPGEIKISTQVIESSSSGMGPEPLILEIRIEDDGPGIKKEDRLRIFEPYTSTKTEKSRGTGLGLWVVSEVIRGHGGTIRLETPKVGTRFLIHLPLASEEIEQKLPEEKIALGGGNILLVDDDDLVRQTVRGLLEALEYEVTEAIDGLEALEVYKEFEGRFDLVLLDQRMPKLSGLECLQQLLQIDKSVKVVITSGDRLSKIDESAKSNIVGVLPKPYTLQVLSQVLSKAMKTATVDELI